MSSTIWNFSHPLRTGYQKLEPHGAEFFGTVIRTGRMKKTSTVMVQKFRFNKKYGKWF